MSQAYCQQPANEARFAVLADAYCTARVRSAELMARFFPFLLLLSIVAKAIALAVAAPRLAAGGDLSYGVLIAFLLYLDLFFTPIQQLSFVFDQWLQARVALTQLRELLRTPSATPPAPASGFRRERLDGRIQLEHVTFVYPSTGLVAMNDVSLDIPAGQTVALVGTTGAGGKSTLVKLIARFYDPTSGAVLIDGLPPHRTRPGGVPPTTRLRPAGAVPVLRNDPIQHRLWQSGCTRPGRRAGGPRGRSARFHRRIVLRLPHSRQ